jgi:3D (Asp-Asp-Asp) domain-containing protein/peptidoglycan hydrolase CwlO-like protein
MATPGQIDGQIDELQAQSGELDASYQQALSDMVAVDSEVNRYNSDITGAGQRRDEIQAEIQTEQQNLGEIEARLSSQQASLEKRLLSTYKSDDVSYLDVVLGAGDFDDFLNRVDMVNIIAEEDRQLIDSIRDSKTSIEDKLTTLSQKQDELASLIDELSSAQDNLLAAQARQEQVVANIKAQMADNESQLTQLQDQAAAIETSMSQIQDTAADSGGDSGYSPPPAGGSSFTMTATAYCLGGTTATGMPVGRGVIAVDPSVIPLGSRVHVSGYGDAIAADTGGAIRGNKIDVWLPCGEAYSWGVRTVTVTVY